MNKILISLLVLSITEFAFCQKNFVELTSFSAKIDFTALCFIPYPDTILIAGFDFPNHSIIILNENGKIFKTIKINDDIKYVSEMKFSLEQNALFLLEDFKNRVSKISMDTEQIEQQLITTKDDWYFAHSSSYHTLWINAFYYLMPKYAKSDDLGSTRSLLSNVRNGNGCKDWVDDTTLCYQDPYRLEFWENSQSIYFPYFKVLYRVSKNNINRDETMGIDTLWYVGHDLLPNSTILFFDESTSDLLYLGFDGYQPHLFYRNLNKKIKFNLDEFTINDWKISPKKERGKMCTDYYYNEKKEELHIVESVGQYGLKYKKKYLKFEQIGK